MTIITGQVCDNTCIGFQPGDNAFVYDIFGQVDLSGMPFVLDILPTGYSLTIDNHTINFGFNDAHYSIVASPTPLSFTANAIEFVAQGLYSPAGFAGPEYAQLCPAIPEPATWALFFCGLMFLSVTRRRWKCRA